VFQGRRLRRRKRRLVSDTFQGMMVTQFLGS
jgi:hypothetical protein